MSFLLFLLVNAVLFIRPGDVVEELLGAPVYQVVILLCVASALPQILQVLFGQSLDRQPITLCVLGLFVAVVVSHLAQGDFSQAVKEGQSFGKILVYYLLLVATVNTPRRLRCFLAFVVLFVMVVCIFGVLQYHGVIRLPSYKAPIKENVLDENGKQVAIERLQATGIFQDPNDLCAVVSGLTPICLFGLLFGAGLPRLFWLGPLAMYGYTIYLTYSRGGLMALLGGLAFCAVFRFGGKRGLMVMLLAVPLLLVAFAGRQASISTNAASAQSRIGLWSEWLGEFRASPLFGKGPVCEPEIVAGDDPFAPKAVHLAHNSFLQSFADMGVFGGILFIGAFYFAFEALARYGFGRTYLLDRGLDQIHPYLIGSLAGYMISMLALSIGYITSTYLWLGLATAFTRMAVSMPPVPRPVVNRVMLQRWALASVCFLAAVYVVIRVFRTF